MFRILGLSDLIRNWQDNRRLKRFESAYRSDFIAAVKFTRSLGFAVAPIIWTDPVELPRDELVRQSLGAAGLSDARGSAGQCLKWSHFLVPYVSKVAGCPAWVTLGQLWKGTAPVFEPTSDDVRLWAARGIRTDDLRSGEGLKLHAWITLATGEIVEPTLPTTIASCHDHYRHFDGAVMMADADKFSPHRYVPLAVGHDIVEGIARRSTIPLLAGDVAELMMVGMILAGPDIT